MIEKQKRWLFTVAAPEILDGYPIRHSYFAPTRKKAEKLLHDRFGADAINIFIREESMT